MKKSMSENFLKILKSSIKIRKKSFFRKIRLTAVGEVCEGSNAEGFGPGTKILIKVMSFTHKIGHVVSPYSPMIPSKKYFVSTCIFCHNGRAG